MSVKKKNVKQATKVRMDRIRLIRRGVMLSEADKVASCCRKKQRRIVATGNC